MTWKIRACSIAAALAAAITLISQPMPVEHVGPRPDGSVLLATGHVLRPAGRQVPLSTFPMAAVVSPDRKYVVVLQGGYRPPSVSLHDAATFAELDRTGLPDAWLGLVFAPRSNVFYVSGGSRSTIYELAITAAGKLERRRDFPVIAEAQRKPTDFVGDVTLSPDGRVLYAAAIYRDSVFLVNPQSGMVMEEWKSAHRPYRILFHPDGKSFFVTGWGDSSLHHYDAANGSELGRWVVGPQPMDMLWRTKAVETEEGEAAPAYKQRLFVTVSGTNTVLVFGVDENKRLARTEVINVALFPQLQRAGMTPSALALSADETKLWVICSDVNALAQVDVHERQSRVEGFIPVGWYPTAATELPDGTLMVLNGKGARSFPNPQGPNPSIRQAPLHEGNVAVQYVGAIQTGTASLIGRPTAEQLDGYTLTARANSSYQPSAEAPPSIPAGNPLGAARSPIEHVIYVVKENRTYDQVLGDLKIGNGDASLTLFGEDVSPNFHKLAREFVLLDNFYVNADVSADGHNWSSAAIAPAYVQRFWPNSYAGRRKFYDYEGGERAAQPPAGYIWSNALQRGLTVRNYGWWAVNITPAPAAGAQISLVKDPALAPHTNKDFRGFDLDYPDGERIKVFLADLARFESENKMPRFITLRLGNDHTSGAAAGKIAPKSAVADNDAAIGQLIEALSRSKFWASTAVFILEDDAQNGPDHVDSHRSPAFVISPYTRGRGVDSSFYNTVSMLRTMEIILGMSPMTLHDAGARVMWRAFASRADLTPYKAEPPRIPLDARNPAGKPVAMNARPLDLSEADRADDDDMNESIWRAVRGTDPPAPVRSLWGR